MPTLYPTNIDLVQVNQDNTDIVLAEDVNIVSGGANQAQVALGAQPVTGISDSVSYVGGVLPAPNVLGGFNGVIVNYPTAGASGTQVGWASIISTQIRAITGKANYRTAPDTSMATVLNAPYITNGAVTALTGETPIATVINAGALSSRPAAAAGNTGWVWIVTSAGTATSPNLSVARSDGANWVNFGFMVYGSYGAGDIIYYDNTNSRFTRLGIGTSGQALTVSGGLPAWATLSATTVGGIPVSTGVADGDMLMFSGGSWTRLPVGSSGQVVTSLGGFPSWSTVGGIMISSPSVWNGVTWTSYGTIQAAITGASSGEFVVIPPGIYTESITLKDGVIVGELIPGTVTITSAASSTINASTPFGALMVDSLINTAASAGAVIGLTGTGAGSIYARFVQNVTSAECYGVSHASSGTLTLYVDMIDISGNHASTGFVTGVDVATGTVNVWCTGSVIVFNANGGGQAYGYRLLGSSVGTVHGGVWDASSPAGSSAAVRQTGGTLAVYDARLAGSTYAIQTTGGTLSLHNCQYDPATVSGSIAYLPGDRMRPAQVTLFARAFS